MSGSYRVTDEALIAETMVWPNFFLMNVFFALKESKTFIIITILRTQAYKATDYPRAQTLSDGTKRLGQSLFER